MTSDISTISDLTESGSPVKSRVDDPLQAQEIANRFLRDDITRASRRVKVQGMFNGNAQKSHADLVAAGRGNEANLNWREHKGHIINAWTPYFDLREQVPVCIDGDLVFSEPAKDARLMRGFAQCFHNMVFNHDGFDENTQLCDLQMLLHGIGVKVWEDEFNPFPTAILAGNIYVPDETNITLDNCEMMMITRSWTVSQLWAKIRDPKRAKAMKWDVEACKQAIMDSAGSNTDMIAWKWDRWEQALKNGDIYVSQTQTKRLQLCTLFVLEMNGKISQKIIPFRPGGGPTKFLYDAQDKYDGWDQVCCAFPFDIGADGTWHSIRGLGTEIYATCALSNNARNSIADMVVNYIKPMWQPTSNAKMEDFKLTKFSGGNMIPNGLANVTVPLGTSIAPAIEVLREFNSTLSRNTGAYNQGDMAPPTVEETAKAAMIRASERAKMTKGAYNRHYRAMTREYKEMWRRATNPNIKSWHPGGREALEFQAKCHAICDRYGVDREALQAVSNIRAKRDIGYGSAAMRFEISSQLLGVIDRLDQTGQQEVLRSFVSTMTSFNEVEAFVPSPEAGRARTEDEAVAAQEDNSFAILGEEAEAFVLPDQNHVSHLQIHVPSMQKDMAACQQGMMEAEECFKRISAKGKHADEHLAMLDGNPTKKGEFKAFKEALDELAAYRDELVANLEQAAADAPPEEGEMTPEMAKVQGNLEIKAQKEQATMELRAQKQAFDQQLRAQQAEFDKALADAKAASEINRATAESRTYTALDVAAQREKMLANSGSKE